MDPHKPIRDLAQPPQGESKSNSNQDHELANISGTFRIVEHHPIPIPRPRHGDLEANLICMWSAQSGLISTALRITYKEPEGFSDGYSEVINEEEIQDLRKAIAFLREKQDRIKDGARTYTEVTYAVESGFTLGMFVDDKQTAEYCIVEGQTVFLRSLDALDTTLEHAERGTFEAKSTWDPC